jgi:hypothetical protein
VATVLLEKALTRAVLCGMMLDRSSILNGEPNVY